MGFIGFLLGLHAHNLKFNSAGLQRRMRAHFLIVHCYGFYFTCYMFTYKPIACDSLQYSTRQCCEASVERLLG